MIDDSLRQYYFSKENEDLANNSNVHDIDLVVDKLILSKLIEKAATVPEKDMEIVIDEYIKFKNDKDEII